MNNEKTYSVWLLPTKMDSNDPYFKINRLIWEIGNKRKIIKNDIAYIYTSSEKRICYKCKIASDIIKKDDKYIFDIKILSKYNNANEELNYESLKLNGLLSTLQSAERLKGNLLNYINEIDRTNDFIEKIKKEAFAKNRYDVIEYIINKGITTQSYENVKEKQKLSYINGKIKPWRNQIKAANVLKKSKYLCEYNKKDRVFERESGMNYTESHHLIPISRYNDFKYSLDVEANIVALCCYCHRVLHYGKLEEKKPILKKLYRNRIKDLEECGLKITFNKLLSYYK